LRVAYNEAVTAHANWARAVARATLRGLAPPEELLAEEANARRRMEAARDELLAGTALRRVSTSISTESSAIAGE
jgi:hypothetical protein